LHPVRAAGGNLRGIKPAGTKDASGNEANAWDYCQLPAELQKHIEETADRLQYRNPEALLARSSTGRKLIDLDKICDDDKAKAEKLKTAKLPWLLRRHDTWLTSAEMDTAGVEDYRRVFGHTIATRYWRELFTRTVMRAGTREEWNRLEFYLPDEPRLKASPAGVVSAALDDDFAEIQDYIAACGNPHNPTDIERNGIWTLALEKYASLVRSGQAKKIAARRVRQFLLNYAPFRQTSRDALWIAWKRKLGTLESANGDVKALRDGRAENGARFELPENDRDLLVHRAVFYYRGDVAPAWRELLRGGKFSPDVINRYKANAAKKSYVPASVMDSVGAEVEILTVMHQGPRAFDAIKGHVTRSWNGIHSLQCMSADDFTMNTYFYIPDGKGGFELTRGQVILFIDFRSSRILGWALEPRKSYSSLTIRTLCTHIFSVYGVPQILYFERGLWKSATLLKGKKDPFTFAEISQGLREFGIIFKHAIRPRTKTVERIGGMFQDIAEAEPGYCGRDERRDAPETLRPQMAEVETGKVHPSKYFYSFEQWNERIGKLVEKHNTEVQEGIMLDGKSPDQAFEEYIDKTNPPMQFPPGLRYLLAHDKRLMTVTLNGITIQIGKKRFNYKWSGNVHLVGDDVLAWFDPEHPETIVITTPDQKKPICVSLSEEPNALECLVYPESGTLGRELARCAAQASQLKTRFNVVKAKFSMPARVLLDAAQALDLGKEIDQQKSSIAQNRARKTQQRARARKILKDTGIAIPEGSRSTASPARLREMQNFLK
jgi:hypothetical protein